MGFLVFGVRKGLEWGWGDGVGKGLWLRCFFMWPARG